MLLCMVIKFSVNLIKYVAEMAQEEKLVRPVQIMFLLFLNYYYF